MNNASLTQSTTQNLIKEIKEHKEDCNSSPRKQKNQIGKIQSENGNSFIQILKKGIQFNSQKSLHSDQAKTQKYTVDYQNLSKFQQIDLVENLIKNGEQSDLESDNSQELVEQSDYSSQFQLQRWASFSPRLFADEFYFPKKQKLKNQQFDYESQAVQKQNAQIQQQEDNPYQDTQESFNQADKLDQVQQNSSENIQKVYNLQRFPQQRPKKQLRFNDIIEESGTNWRLKYQSGNDCNEMNNNYPKCKETIQSILKKKTMRQMKNQLNKLDLDNFYVEDSDNKPVEMLKDVIRLQKLVSQTTGISVSTPQSNKSMLSSLGVNARNLKNSKALLDVYKKAF